MTCLGILIFVEHTPIKDIDINGNFLVEGTKRNSKMNTVVAADEAVRYLTSLMVEVQKLAPTSLI